jgi:hypothetical protein
LVVTGTNNAVRDLIPPVVKKLYTIANNTTGGYAIRVIGVSGTGVNIPNGATCLVYCDGTNFVNGLSGSAGNFSISGALAVTGTTSLTGATTLSSTLAVTGTSTFTGIPSGPTAAPGTNTTQLATTAFVLANGIPSGTIVLWSGSIGSIPSGWLLCNGSSGTPDLRDRFVVGAGSTYAVAATGGNANATLPSHTHTASTTISNAAHQHYVVFNAEQGNEGTLNASNTIVRRGSFGSDYNYDFASNSSAANIGLTNTAGGSLGVSVTNSTEGSSATNANLPPYYALAYIMKA